MERRLTLETLFAGVLTVLGAAIAAVSWSYGFGTLARPGPGLYPFFIGVITTVLGAVALACDLREPARRAARLDPVARKRLALMSAIFVFWILALPVLGYVLVTLAAVYAFAKTLELEGQGKPLAIAAGTALFIYLLFDHWLYIDLPRGMLLGG
ncbi:MAG: tripartite tricarboxylate transporter TctB family protein [Rhodospirillaceae bacterium]